MGQGKLSEEELDQLLQRASRTRPVSQSALATERVEEALDDAWRAAIAAGAGDAQPRRSGSRMVRRRWAVAGVAAAAVAVASLVGIQSLTGDHSAHGFPLEVSSAQAAQLNRVARATARQAGLSDGQWIYEDATAQIKSSESSGNATVTSILTQRDQDWIGTSGDERTRAINTDFAFVTPEDRATYEADPSAFPAVEGDARSGVITDRVARVSQAQQAFWRLSTPSDPQALISAITSMSASALGKGDPTMRSRALDPELLWSNISDVLTSSASPKLRSLAYAALAYVPGTKVLGKQTDALGRPGVAISFTDPSPAEEIDTLIVDPNTGDLLQEDDTLQAPEGALPAGTVTDRTIYQRPAIVSSSTRLPGGSSLPVAASSADK